MHSHSALGLFLPARAKRGSAETAAGAVRATRTSSRMLKSISSAVSAHPLHKTTATCHKTCVRHAKACSSHQKKHVKYSRANLKGANFSHPDLGAWLRAPERVGSFRKSAYLVLGILPFGVPHQGSLFSETPSWSREAPEHARRCLIVSICFRLLSKCSCSAHVMHVLCRIARGTGRSRRSLSGALF